MQLKLCPPVSFGSKIIQMVADLQMDLICSPFVLDLELSHALYCGQDGL